jgi:Protein of unknown function (DUF1670)
VSGPPRRVLDYRRLARRNLPGLLRYKSLHDYGYDKGAVLVEAIVADIGELLRRYYRRDGDLEPGQLIHPAPDRNERAGRGKTMAATRLVPVRLTIVADEDLEAIRVGARAAARREIRVRRLTHEAIAQGALLSERDLGLLTGYSNSAISLTARALRERGEFLPLRGYVADMGSFPTHKAAIIRLYLQGLLTPDIAARTWHSKEAVDRYIRGFERVRLLAAKHPRDELPLLTGMTMRLIDQHLALLAEPSPGADQATPHALSS